MKNNFDYFASSVNIFLQSSNFQDVLCEYHRMSDWRHIAHIQNTFVSIVFWLFEFCLSLSLHPPEHAPQAVEHI